MTATIPAPESFDEARHWLVLEASLGAYPPIARSVIDVLEGRGRLSDPARSWLESLTCDPDVGGWSRRLLEKAVGK